MNLLVGIAAVLSLALGAVIAVLAATSSQRHVRWAHTKTWRRSGAPMLTPGIGGGGARSVTTLHAVESSSLCFVWQWLPTPELKACPTCASIRRTHKAGVAVIAASVLAMLLSAVVA